ncbi:hypothetical protein Vafri_1722, partial [Volvox africanus]
MRTPLLATAAAAAAAPPDVGGGGGVGFPGPGPRPDSTLEKLDADPEPVPMPVAPAGTLGDSGDCTKPDIAGGCAPQSRVRTRGIRPGAGVTPAVGVAEVII